MEFNIIAVAIPVFFGFIGVEYWVSRRQRRSVFRFSTALADLSCGIGNQVSAILFGGLLFAGYVWIFEHVAIVRWDASQAWVWGVGFILVDVVYYFWHRASHRTNVIWAAHVVHHQSQDYNLAVALRQAWFTQFSNTAFFYVLALLGFPPVVFAVCVSVNTLYQFWIHTQCIGTLGPLEWVLNTPSHHRVHHGINPEYIDKNYAGVLIVWDRFFGTFAPERAPVVYGTVEPFESLNPSWANFAFWRELSERAKQASTFTQKLGIYFGPPEWTPEGMKSIPAIDAATYRKYDVTAPDRAPWYLAVQFLLVTAVLVGELSFQSALPLFAHIIVGGWIVWTTTNFGGMLEQRPWWMSSERFRHVLTPGLAYAVFTLGGASALTRWVVVGVALVISSMAAARMRP